MTKNKTKKKFDLKNNQEKKLLLTMSLLTTFSLVFTLSAWALESIHEKTSHFEQNFIWLFYCFAYISGGYYSAQEVWESLNKKKIDVNLLMILSALGAAYIGELKEGAILMFLFSLSHTLEHYTINKTKKGIRALLKMTPKTARRLITHKGEVIEKEVSIEKIKKNDIVLIKDGEMICVDGLVLEGESFIDESSITGESFPIKKKKHDKVFAGTMNQEGMLKIQVTLEAKDFMIAQIINLVKEARKKKANAQHFTDHIIGQYYTIAVLALTLCVMGTTFLFLGWEFEKSFYRSIMLMVVASPCALVISIPSAILSALASATRQGVLFKGGMYLEKTAQITSVALDKTGTLTEGNPKVTRLLLLKTLDLKNLSFSLLPKTFTHPSLSKEEALLHSLFGSIERFSTHPIAKCITKQTQKNTLPFLTVTAFKSITGKGVQGNIKNKRFQIGHPKAFCKLTATLKQQIKDLEENNQTVIVLSHQKTPLGILTITDPIRNESAKLITDLKKIGVKKIVLLTGDNHFVAQKLAKTLKIDEFYAECSPKDKINKIKQLKKEGLVAMIGDGTNDAPSLSAASIGIAMGVSGTDVAIESADVLLMKDNLSLIPKMINLSKKTTHIIKQNMIFAFLVMLVLIILSFNGTVSLPLSVLGHEGSTILVILNGLRLLKN